MMITLAFHDGYVGADSCLLTGAVIEQLVCVIGWGRSAPRHCV